MAEEKVMNLASCSREEAIEALNKTNNDIVEAVSLLMDVPTGKDAPKPRELSEIQKFFKKTREEMLNLTESISKGFMTSSQSEPSEHSEKQTLPEETAQQSNCLSQCHPLSPELTVQIPEIACPSPSECSSDLQSNDQKLPGSGQECQKSCPCLETESSGKGAETTA
jgi:hypothetical protein